MVLDKDNNDQQPDDGNNDDYENDAPDHGNNNNNNDNEDNMNMMEHEEEEHDKLAQDNANEYGNDEDNESEDDLEYEVGGGEGATIGKHKQQHDEARDGAEGRTYNLRARAPARSRFNQAIDKLHSGKLYFPPTQPTQKGKQLTRRASRARYGTSMDES